MGMGQPSVVILTLNEEANIADCLASCSWCDDVHVLDSGSTDRTREIAAAAGAKVYVNPFTSFGQQRNWAIDNIPVKHDWIFHLDADERFTPELVEEMSHVIASNPEEAGYYVPHKMMFWGQWLRYSSCYPVYQMRLFHKARMRFTDYGHGQREVPNGKLGCLKEAYLHYNFAKGFVDWFDKHTRYAHLEALEALRALESHQLNMKEPLLSTDPVHRRHAMKTLAYHLPCRPTLRFLHMYFLRLGFLDGWAGLTYCRLIAMYERMIVLNMKEIRRRRKGLTI